MVLPSRREFWEYARSHGKQRVPVAAKVPLEATPQDIFRALDLKRPHFLLESARIHAITGRYSIVVGEPRLLLIARGGRVSLAEGSEIQSFEAEPLAVFQKLLDAQPACRIPGFPPFVGGAVGFFGFDAYRYFENLAPRADGDLRLPDLGFGFFDEAVVLDHLRQELWAIVLAPASEDRTSSYDQAAARAEALLLRSTRSPQSEFRVQSSPAPLSSTHTRESFEAMVWRAKEFIARGDIYQANLSQRFMTRLPCEPWVLYERLSSINPSPFAAYADFPATGLSEEFQVICASPERFLRVQGLRIETRPIAGTRPRGERLSETERLRRELLLNEKERAEHLMLVDLERNDLGRICRYGTVEVDTLMDLEEYSHVIHIISNVRGLVRQGVPMADLLAATFPGGTITGCPKVRCLEILEMLEPVRRELYTGSLGFISYTGDIDFNLIIRTALVTGESVFVHTGAGIVADSDPGKEYEETLHKARALLLALHVESNTKTLSPVPA